MTDKTGDSPLVDPLRCTATLGDLRCALNRDHNEIEHRACGTGSKPIYWSGQGEGPIVDDITKTIREAGLTVSALPGDNLIEVDEDNGFGLYDAVANYRKTHPEPTHEDFKDRVSVSIDGDVVTVTLDLTGLIK